MLGRMTPTPILWYTASVGQNPVKGFLDSLSKKQRAKFVRIITTIEDYGLLSILPHIRKLSGTPLWEIRILGKDNIRVLYACVQGNSVLFLHGFIKKKQKTPLKEIFVALDRLQDWRSSS
jgi:phage-related protein